MKASRKTKYEQNMNFRLRLKIFREVENKIL